MKAVATNLEGIEGLQLDRTSGPSLALILARAADKVGPGAVNAEVTFLVIGTDLFFKGSSASAEVGGTGCANAEVGGGGGCASAEVGSSGGANAEVAGGGRQVSQMPERPVVASDPSIRAQSPVLLAVLVAKQWQN